MSEVSSPCGDGEGQSQLLDLFADAEPAPRAAAPAPDSSQHLFRDKWAYLTEWFVLSGDIERSATQNDRDDDPLLRLPGLIWRSKASHKAGVRLPVETCAAGCCLDDVDRLLLIALLRDALSPASEGGLTCSRLLNATGVTGLLMSESVRCRLEVGSRLRSEGLLECNLDPVPSRRLYRLSPVAVEVLRGDTCRRAIPGGPLGEAVDFLCRHVRDLLRRITGDTERASPWRAAPETGPGWSETRSAADSLRRVIAMLSTGRRGPISEKLRDLDSNLAQQALLALLVYDARYRLGGSPAGLALSFVSALTDEPQTPNGLFGESSALVNEKLVEVLPGRAPYDATLRLSDEAERNLLPGTAAGRPQWEKVEEANFRPFDRVEPKTKLDDVVLSESLRKELDDALAALRSRDLLFGAWGFTSPSYAGNGAVLLFEGPPGTGKSYAAEALAGELGRPLYRVRFDQLQAKWLGETEKMIAGAFRAAERENALLLVDEADAVLGARDRAAQSWEVRHVNCLLQEIERFPGIAVFTTNRPAALDPALERRLAARLHFPLPGFIERVALWLAHLPEKAPKAKDVDLVALAEKFALSGSQIRTAALRAAALAAQRDGYDRVIRQSDLLEAAGRVAKSEPEKTVGFETRLVDDRG